MTASSRKSSRNRPFGLRARSPTAPVCSAHLWVHGLAPLSAKLPVPVAEESGYAGSCAIWRRARLRMEGASNAKIESCFMDRPRLGTAGERRSDFGDVDDRLGKGLWGFLRQVVPHAARDEPVLIFTREFAAISRGFRMGAPLASPSIVIVGTVMMGPWASFF